MSGIKITSDHDTVTVKIPRDEVQALRVALAPCPCRANKSIATATTRQRLVRALGYALLKKRDQ